MEYQYDQDNNNGNYYQGNNDYSYYHASSYNSSPMPEQRKKKEKKTGKGLILVCLLVSLAAGTAGGALGGGLALKNSGGGIAAQTPSVQEETVTVSELPETTETIQAASASTAQETTGLTVAQIAQQCLPSVVAITNKGETEIRTMWGTFTQESESSGSGVIIGQTDSELLIVTNYHVVSGNEELSVLFSYQENSADSEIAQAKIKDYDAGKDIAVIAIDLSSLPEETLNNIRVAKMGDSGELVLGEQIVAIGNALGYGQSVTTGVVSALGRSVSVQDASSGASSDSNEYIQTDAAINPGNSGGAMFNMKGELVGINSAKIADTQVEGVGYAIPISDVKSDIENMMLRETRDVVEEDQRGYFGISVSNVTTQISEAYDIPKGAYISSVTEGSPAEQAGLVRGMVITELDGKSIDTSEELKEYLSYYAAGETVTLNVKVRADDGYVDKTIKVTLCSADEAGISEESGETKAPAQEEQEQQNSGNGYNPFGGFFPFFN